MARIPQAGPGADRGDVDPDDGRDETAAERLDRNWNSLLQELRVLQTGTQLLTGFLLTIVFQPTFTKLDPWQVGLYLAVVSLSTFSTLLVLMPVALHRRVFRQRGMHLLVQWGDRMVRLGLLATGLAIVGVITLVFSAAAGVLGAVLGGIGAVVAIGVLWLALPSGLRRRLPAEHD